MSSRYGFWNSPSSGLSCNLFFARRVYGAGQLGPTTAAATAGTGNGNGWHWQTSGRRILVLCSVWFFWVLDSGFLVLAFGNGNDDSTSRSSSPKDSLIEYEHRLHSSSTRTTESTRDMQPLPRTPHTSSYPYTYITPLCSTQFSRRLQRGPRDGLEPPRRTARDVTSTTSRGGPGSWQD
ncbi:hypothetical protein DENSPDRAFT_268131 [Dentipellis sp. KUC8613]|nr:hypothetical protein DENSPDRAFT_268131 [Dentipellis sp. KUC8613]